MKRTHDKNDEVKKEQQKSKKMKGTSNINDTEITKTAGSIKETGNAKETEVVIKIADSKTEKWSVTKEPLILEEKKVKNRIKLAYYRWTLICMGVWFFIAFFLLYIISPIGYHLFMLTNDSDVGLLTGYQNWNLVIEITVISETVFSIIMVVIILIDRAIKSSNPRYQEVDFENASLVRVPYVRGVAVIGFIMIIIGIAEIFVAWIISLFLNKKKKFSILNAMGNNLFVANLMLGMTCLFTVAFLDDIRPMEQYQSFSEDIVAIEEGTCSYSVVQFSPKVHDDDYNYMDGKYDSVTQCFHACSRGGEEFKDWTKFYIPKSKNFALDPNHLYSENGSTEWNIKNATLYAITYTPNNKLIIEIKEMQNPEEP